MTDKEKEAIEILEAFNLAGKVQIIEQDEFEDVKQAIETVLDRLKFLERENTVINNLAKTYKNQRDEKDQIIDLMADRLTTPIHSKEWVKRYYEEEVGD